MKKLLSFILALTMVLALASCGNAVAETSAQTSVSEQSSDTSALTEPVFTPVDMSIATLKGPTGMGLTKLMDDTAKGTAKNNYTFSIDGDPTAVSAAVIKGEVDIACVPVNLASVLFSKTDGAYICVAINTLGVLHIVENGETVNSISDLEGKTLYATGQGSTPEYILNYILEKNNLTDKVTVEYKTEHSELAALLADGTVTLAMLPEPNVSSALVQNSNLRLAIDMTAEWDKVCDSSAVQGCVIVKKEFAEKKPDALAVFMDEYAASVAFVNENVADAAAMCETYGIVPKSAIAAKAYPNCNIVFVTGNEMKTDLSAFLGVLFEANPASVGGALPADDFYYGAN